MHTSSLQIVGEMSREENLKFLEQQEKLQESARVSHEHLADGRTQIEESNCGHTPKHESESIYPAISVL